jgi:hypothetical protein
MFKTDKLDMLYHIVTRRGFHIGSHREFKEKPIVKTPMSNYVIKRWLNR